MFFYMLYSSETTWDFYYYCHFNSPNKATMAQKKKKNVEFVLLALLVDLAGKK